MATYRDEGIVLRTMRLGEADRIVTLATPHHGKVRAVAKGVRRTKSRFGGRVEPLCHVRLLAWQGRELDILTQVETVETYRAIRETLERLGPAMTMLEIVDQFAHERQAMPELFSMLAGALRATATSAPSPLLLGGFCFKLLALEGFGPIADRCAGCDGTGPFVAFDPELGGLLCRDCRRGQAVSSSAAALLVQILSGGLGRALAAPETKAAAELERLGLDAVEYHLERRLRTRWHSTVLPAPLSPGGAPVEPGGAPVELR